MTNNVFVYLWGYTKLHEMYAIGLTPFKHPMWTNRPTYQEMLIKHYQAWLWQSSDASFTNNDDIEEFDLTNKTIPKFEVYTAQFWHAIKVDEVKHQI